MSRLRVVAALLGLEVVVGFALAFILGASILQAIVLLPVARRRARRARGVPL